MQLATDDVLDHPLFRADASTVFAALDRIGEQPVFTIPASDVPAHFRPSSVLLLFVAHEDGVALVLTRRAARLAKHAGEICFPGGRLEPGEDALAAALREANEEIGLDGARVRVHGRLDDAWAFGGYVVVPIVASLDALPTLVPTSHEVDAVIVEPISRLFDASRFDVEYLSYRGVDYQNARIALPGADVLFGLSADLLLEVGDRLVHGRTERGAARLEELRQSVAAGNWR